MNLLRVCGGVYDDENGEAAQKEWYPSGQLRMECHYRLNKLNGKDAIKRYYESGALEVASDYENGECHGERTWKNEDGTVERLELWDEGSQDGEIDGSAFNLPAPGL